MDDPTLVEFSGNILGKVALRCAPTERYYALSSDTRVPDI